MSENYAVFVGLDVGKSAHHACALAQDGSRLYDKPLVQDEVALRKVFVELQQHGPVLMIVDQPNTIGALPIALARDGACEVANLPGLAMRNAAYLYPGRSKTDARDAFIIADTARTMPHTLRAVDRDSEVLSALKMLAGFDDDIARDCTRAKNRLRSVLTQIHPAFERVLVGEILARAIVLDLLIHDGGPTKLAAAGRGRVLKWARNRSRKDPVELIDRIFAALAEQTVTVPGTDAAELVIPQLAANIKALQQQRETIAGQVEGMLDEFPLAEVLISMPGIGIKTASNILLAVGDCSDFASASHLAAYAGIAPVTRRSGTSIKGEFPARSGNKRLKNAMFRSAWIASNCHGPSQAYYQRKRAEGKKHNAAVMCLARRRSNVIYAMLTNREFYREPPAPNDVAAAACSDHQSSAKRLTILIGTPPRARDPVARPAQDLLAWTGPGTRPGRGGRGDPPGTVDRRHGPLRKREIHPHALPRRSGHARPRHGHARLHRDHPPVRRAAAPAAPHPRRLRLPVVQPRPRALRPREHRAARPTGPAAPPAVPGSTTWWTRWGSGMCSDAAPTSSPAGSSSGWPSRATTFAVVFAAQVR